MAGEIVAIRKPPVDAVFALHLPRQRGKCRWCGKPVDEEGRQVWHSACEDEFKTIIDPSFARYMLEQRDHGICAKCGEDYSDRFRLLAAQQAWISEDGRSWYDQPPAMPFPTDVIYREFVFLRQVSLWHNDHVVPLWAVRRLEPIKRIEYFKLANMQTLCDACHKIKCRAEEAEKAKMDRQAGEGRKEKPKKPWPSRPMGARKDFERRPVKYLDED